MYHNEVMKVYLAVREFYKGAVPQIKTRLVFDDDLNEMSCLIEPLNAAKLNSSSFAPLLVKYFPPTCLRAAIDSEWSEQSSVDVLKEPVSVLVASRILEIHFVHCYPKWPTKVRKSKARYLLFLFIASLE